MHNSFIPKDNYISRIADRLKKEEVRNYFIVQCNRLKVQPKDMKLFISENMDLPNKELIMRAYDEFYNDVHKAIKSIDKGNTAMFTNMLKVENEAIKKKFKLK